MIFWHKHLRKDEWSDTDGPIASIYRISEESCKQLCCLRQACFQKAQQGSRKTKRPQCLALGCDVNRVVALSQKRGRIPCGGSKK